MAAGQPRPPPLSSSVRRERLLRAACAAMAAAGALLLRFSAQTKTVLFIQKKAVSKDVQALWVLIVAAAAAAAYHAAQLAWCLCMDRLASTGGGGAGCRRLGRAIACATFLLDKGSAYMVFATTVAALQACFVALLGVEALQWSKLCNIYTRFCELVAAGMVCSLLAAAGMAVLSAFSARDLFRAGRCRRRTPLGSCSAFNFLIRKASIDRACVCSVHRQLSRMRIKQLERM